MSDKQEKSRQGGTIQTLISLTNTLLLIGVLVTLAYLARYLGQLVNAIKAGDLTIHVKLPDDATVGLRSHSLYPLYVSVRD